MAPARILLLDETGWDIRPVEQRLREGALLVTVRQIRGENELGRALREHEPEIILVRAQPTAALCIRLAETVRTHTHDAALIFLADRDSEDAILTCIQNGATDCIGLERPIRLVSVIRAEVEKRTLRADCRRLAQQQSLLNRAAPGLVCVLDENGILEEVGPGWRTELGFESIDLVGHPIAKCIDLVDRPGFLAWFRGIPLSAATPEMPPSDYPSCEARVRDNASVVHPYRWSARANEDGTKVFLYAHRSSDLGGSLRSKLQAQADARFRALADSAAVLIWMADASQARTYCNRPWLEFTGQSLSHELGTGWMISVHPEDRTRCQEVYRDSFGARRPFRLEYRLRRFDGQYRWVLDSGTPHYDENADFIGFLGSCVDISDQHEAETRLAYRAIKQAALAGFSRFALSQHPLEALMREATRVICDTLRVEVSQVFALAPGSQTLSLVAATGMDAYPNASSTNAWTMDVAEDAVILLGEPLERFPGWETHADLNVQSGLAVSISSGKRPYGYLTVLSHQPQAFSRDAIDFVQGVANVIGTVYQRERAQAALEESEQKLLQSQKMEAVGILAGGVAHDFNNLLTAIRCYSDILSDDLAEAAPHLQPKAGEILKATARASALTRQLLAFSRKQILQPEVLDLNHVVNDLKDLIRSLLSENVLLNVNLCETPAYFEADRNQFDQVIINLCINARDAMPNGGLITIAVSTCTLTPENSHGLNPGEYVELHVADTGVGMSDEVKSHLFQPFFTTKPKGRGTGLGLATCAVIVKSCNGTIHFSSEMGYGTTFRVLLPRIHPPGIHRVIDDEAALREGTERILLVEDDEAIRAVTATILETLGYHVQAVAGGEEAIELCSGERKARFDLLLTDIVMPYMDGRELAEKIAALCPGIRIIFMSGYVSDPAILQAVQDAGAPFLEKPFTRSSLARKVRDALESAPRATPV